MNSRERVLKALAHQEPDRVPIDFGGGAATGLSAVAHHKLLKHLGLRGETKVWHQYLQWPVIEPQIVELFEVDCINVVPIPTDWKRDVLPDGSPGLVPTNFDPRIEPDGTRLDVYAGHIIGKLPPGGHWYDPVYFPLANATEADLDGFSWMPPFSFYMLPDVSKVDQMVQGVREAARAGYENTDKAIVGFAGASIYETAQGLRGYEQLFIDFIENRKFLDKLLDKIADAGSEYAKRYCDAIGDYAQVIVVGGEDIGAQGRLQIKPATYREVVIPRVKRLWQTFRKHTDAYLFVHTCGYIEPIINDLIDAGIDIINPVQIGAGMDPQRLKAQYGDRVTFWGGGINTQTTLPHGTVAEVKAEVKERLKILAPGGGFVFAAEQTIQSDVPPENIVAMNAAVRQYGRYPIQLD
ncbi:MAG: hypothetical protein JSW39_12260 [Desulfobacterales bacterium]|nr:MAG: hypothetical protein JSW39_12260 [Desulfobacterales bacterium]